MNLYMAIRYAQLSAAGCHDLVDCVDRSRRLECASSTLYQHCEGELDAILMAVTDLIKEIVICSGRHFQSLPSTRAQRGDGDQSQFQARSHRVFWRIRAFCPQSPTSNEARGERGRLPATCGEFDRFRFSRKWVTLNSMAPCQQENIQPARNAVPDQLVANLHVLSLQGGPARSPSSRKHTPDVREGILKA